MSARPSPSPSRRRLARAARQEAVRLERQGDLAGALGAYEKALQLTPGEPELLTALADLAGRLGLHEEAIGFWAAAMAGDPASLEPVVGCARALGAVGRFDEAIDQLRSALLVRPEECRLWTALGVTLTHAGRAQEAIVFFDEAVRLAPAAAAGFYNRGVAWTELGEPERAEADFRDALQRARTGAETAATEFALALLALSRGRLAEGWDAYEARLSPDWPKSVLFEAPGRRLAEDVPLAGRSVLVIAEQGLGDEIMFASLLPDVLAEVGPEGRVAVAAEPRLVGLLARSFPEAAVSAHATDRLGARPRRRAPDAPAAELWCPMASLPRRFRRGLADFPRRTYLKPDPQRVAHWRAWLAGPRPSVGLSWRSGKLIEGRQRFYPALADWLPLLRTPGVRFVNLQYGDCAEDLAGFAAEGVELVQPPGVDLKNDLDELAALSVALDLVVSVQNATGVLAAACGAETLFVAGAGSWAELGQAEPPWFPRARIWSASVAGDWEEVLREPVGRVAALARRGSAAG